MTMWLLKSNTLWISNTFEEELSHVFCPYSWTRNCFRRLVYDHIKCNGIKYHVCWQLICNLLLGKVVNWFYDVFCWGTFCWQGTFPLFLVTMPCTLVYSLHVFAWSQLTPYLYVHINNVVFFSVYSWHLRM